MISVCLLAFSLQFRIVLGDLSNFGEYDVCLDSLDLMNEKKSENLSKVHIRIDYDERGKQVVFLNVTILEENGPLKSARHFESLSMKDFVKQILGVRTFYGRFKAKVIFYGNRGNILKATGIASFIKEGACKPIKLSK